MQPTLRLSRARARAVQDGLQEGFLGSRRLRVLGGGEPPHPPAIEHPLPAAASRPAFFFELGCPASYLAAERIERAFGQVSWVPTARLSRSWAADALTVATALAPVRREAAALRLPLVMPEHFGVDPVSAARATAFAASQGEGARFALASFRLEFCGGYDLDTRAVLAEAARAGRSQRPGQPAGCRRLALGRAALRNRSPTRGVAGSPQPRDQDRRAMVPGPRRGQRRCRVLCAQRAARSGGAGEDELGAGQRVSLGDSLARISRNRLPTRASSRAAGRLALCDPDRSFDLLAPLPLSSTSCCMGDPVGCRTLAALTGASAGAGA